MRLFDTHCHFETSDRAEIAALLARARAAGVEKIMAIGGSPELNESALAAGELGCLVAQGFDRDQTELPGLPSLSRNALAALGEIGLDYRYSPETRDAQLKLFASQLEQAKEMDLPVVIHTRDADEDTLAVLGEVPSRGIIHCFTGTPEFAGKLLDLGFSISFSGIVTFKSAEDVRRSALFVPDDRVLIETDSPYLAPVPMRGRANEPAFIVHTCEFLAKIRGWDACDFAELTYSNAVNILAGT